jgi:hypothetical protein
MGRRPWAVAQCGGGSELWGEGRDDRIGGVVRGNLVGRLAATIQKVDAVDELSGDVSPSRTLFVSPQKRRKNFVLQ